MLPFFFLVIVVFLTSLLSSISILVILLYKLAGVSIVSISGLILPVFPVLSMLSMLSMLSISIFVLSLSILLSSLFNCVIFVCASSISDILPVSNNSITLVSKPFTNFNFVISSFVLISMFF